MIIKDLKQFSLSLKKSLQDNETQEMAERIAFEIKEATHVDGTLLTSEEIEHVIRYLEYPVYDHVSGRMILHETDNSEFLKLVALVSKKAKDKK